VFKAFVLITLLCETRSKGFPIFSFIRPFCITILYHNLLLFIDIFIFRDDTYVVSSVSTCLMIVGGFAAGVRILLEKDRQDTIFRKIRKILENYQKIIFCRKTQEARRRRREEPGSRLTRRGRGLAPGRAGLLCGHPGPLQVSPLRVLHRPRKPKSGGFRDRDRRLCEVEKHQRE
jgi:hypothetical protein